MAAAPRPERAPEELSEDFPERDERTFRERVESVNVAFLVRMPLALVERFADLVQDDIEDTKGRLIFTTTSTERLFIEKARPRDDRDERPRERRFTYGTDR